ncbi:MAG: PIG-L family deacetylase [Anaerolineae bacterium]|nr:PIG-L family deacetylase [Anaerolineae bacterium]
MAAQVHLFLSPHADDAALSCGGQIASLTRQHQVTIFTLMIGQPPPEALNLPLAVYFHRKWGLGANVVTVRRAEDRLAARRMGSALLAGDLLEAGYRRDSQGNACYVEPASLHLAPNPADPLLQLLTGESVRNIFQAQGVVLSSDLVIHAPLGVGNHVDHQIVREMALLLAHENPALRLVFYEDYPYATWNDKVVPDALNETAARVQPRTLKRVLHPLDLRARLARIAAIASYRSQLSMIWRRGMVGMMLRTWQFMAQRGGEVEWEIT